jgi:hypothetical protein
MTVMKCVRAGAYHLPARAVVGQYGCRAAFSFLGWLAAISGASMCADRLHHNRPRMGRPKYVGPAGFSPLHLYGADYLTLDKPVVLVEGEIDALTVQQVAGDLVTAVATGATGGARRAGWVAQLALAPFVLVAFDVDPNAAGDQAAAWWLRCAHISTSSASGRM